MQEHLHTNSLINESSPYLLQHAHNPVNWYAWNNETLAKAKAEDKMILVSIGYSACHWCHVMEHESFEDEAVAELMNEHFICIKIDREERPDIDQVYMSAVQIMSGQGGWPLNCFALPDGRPVYGGTYFPKQKWMQLLQNIARLYTNDRHKTEQYASELTQGMLKAEQLLVSEDPAELNLKSIEKGMEKWVSIFDTDEGGPARAPKFPLPNNYLFLLQYATLAYDPELLKHLHLTLKKMAFGGIYDQLGGGFARYSVDALWKVPHFEKMLYDNAQLISLYANAYAQSGNELYKNVVVDTIQFVKRELSHADGNLYSALDADSEGEEGKFYIWTKEEIENVLEADTQVFCDFYEVNETGYWEHDHYILLRKQTEKEFCLKYQIEERKLNEILDRCKEKLMNVRDKRIRPGLDDKTLCSWNALMVKAYADAYRALGDVQYKEDALKTASFIREKMTKAGKLLHSYKKGESKITGFLEDYAFVIEAYIKLYEITSDESWLTESKALTEVVLNDFSDTQSPFFYFNSVEDAELIVRKLELSDNVIPASNSQMALNLFYLDKYLNILNYRERAESMVRMIQEEIMHYLPGYSNWATLACNILFPFREVVIIGEKAEEYYKELAKHYFHNTLYAFSKTENDLPLFEGRFVKDKTLIYVCINNACLLPVETVHEAKALLVDAN